MKVRFTAIKKKFDDAEKLRKAQEAKEAVEFVKNYFNVNPELDCLVQKLNTSNSKALSQAVLHVKGLKMKSAMLFAVDVSAGKVSYACIVAKVKMEIVLKKMLTLLLLATSYIFPAYFYNHRLT